MVLTSDTCGDEMRSEVSDQRSPLAVNTQTTARSLSNTSDWQSFDKQATGNDELASTFSPSSLRAETAQRISSSSADRPVPPEDRIARKASSLATVSDVDLAMLLKGASSTARSVPCASETSMEFARAGWVATSRGRLAIEPASRQSRNPL